jgi:hypothetical protein
MDLQSLINIAAGGALALLGWLGRQLWDAVAELRRDLHTIEKELPAKYVRREEFSDGLREIKEICAKIFDKIDALEHRKVDK